MKGKIDQSFIEWIKIITFSYCVVTSVILFIYSINLALVNLIQCILK